jgi:phosphoribosyl-dephospho-CoA transferase
VVEAVRVHDLVRVDPTLASRWPQADPWVAESLARAPWVVVRRERAHPAVAIGVRGTRRSERFAASVACADIREAISPFHCVRGAVRNDRLADAFASIGAFALAWKLRIAPIGSYGFELASGVQTTNESSDLDVLVDATHAPLFALRRLAAHIDALARRSGVRVDVELGYSAGGVALREVLAGRKLVLFKTDSGPKLLPCPV